MPVGSDADVIELSRREPEQFAVLFRRHAPQIQRYVLRRLGPDAADDVVAETFLLAFRQRDRYDLARLDARPWLYGIATNLIGRHRRAEIRQYPARPADASRPRWPGCPPRTATRCCWWPGATCLMRRWRPRSAFRSAPCGPG